MQHNFLDIEKNWMKVQANEIMSCVSTSDLKKVLQTNLSAFYSIS